MLSGRLGVVYKPAESGQHLRLLRRPRSTRRSKDSLTRSPTSAIDPEKTRTFEVGSKWDLLGARLLLTGALFRVEKTNARTPGLVPGDPPQVLDGEQRVDGVELSVTGNMTRSLAVFAGYTLLDERDRQVEHPGGSRQEHPEHAAELLQPLDDLQAAETRTRRRRAFHRPPLRQQHRTRGRWSSYWLLDAMASYPLTDHVDLRLNLYNLTDEYYFDRLGGGHLVPGPGRSAMLSAGFRF